jgi:hypothetical protein
MKDGIHRVINAPAESLQSRTEPIRRAGLLRRPAGPVGSEREANPRIRRLGSSRAPTPAGRAASRRPPNDDRASDHSLLPFVSFASFVLGTRRNLLPAPSSIDVASSHDAVLKWSQLRARRAYRPSTRSAWQRIALISYEADLSLIPDGGDVLNSAGVGSRRGRLDLALLVAPWPPDPSRACRRGGRGTRGRPGPDRCRCAACAMSMQAEALVARFDRGVGVLGARPRLSSGP